MTWDPGWYVDPNLEERERYWDGQRWSDQSRPIEPAPSDLVATPPAPPDDVPGAPRPVAAGGGNAGAATARDRRRRRFDLAATAVVLLAAGVVAYLLVGDESKGGGSGATGNSTQGEQAVSTPGAGPALLAAAALTADKKTVAITVSASLLGAGQSSSQPGLSGGGGFYPSSGLSTLTVSLPGSSAPSQQYIFSGGTVYVNTAGLGATELVPGKTWIVASTAALPSFGADTAFGELVRLLGNPGTLVQQISSSQATVASLGSSTVDGEALRGYAVSLPTTTQAGWGTHTTLNVYVGRDHLIHRVVVPNAVYVDGQKVMESIVVDFSGYGTPLDVGIPPAGLVATTAQYESAAASKGNG